MDKLTSESQSPNLGLDPITSLTMAEIVEVKLQAYLKENNFKIGDALPKEIELAEALGVSRNVIREALSRFRMLGLIESRKKRGMILTSPDVLGGIERVLNPKLLSKEVLKDVFEMRLVFEMGMADLLFRGINPQYIIELERIVHKKSNSDTSIFKLKYEIEFHGKLYEITGNSTLKRFQQLLLPVFEYVVQYESSLENPPKSGSANHVDLLNELKNGTPESFGATMRQHLEPHFEMLLGWNTKA